MKCNVIGKKKMSFKNQQNGELVNVAKISVIHKYPHSDDFCTYEGQQSSEISVPFEYIDEIQVGDNLLLDFDKNGKLLEMEKLD